jgi:hypothetical protein
MAEIHITDQLAFKTCRRRWNWSSRMRMNLEPAIPHAPFLTGRAVHYALERYYRDQVEYETAFAEFSQLNDVPQESVKHVQLGYGMMRHYMRWAKRQRGRYSDVNLQFIDMEHKFKVPVGPRGKEIILAGMFDGIVRDLTTGELWLWEVKTCRSIDERMQTLPIDEQTSAYLLAATKLMKEPVIGVLYTFLKKSLPKEPTVLKNGNLSKALNDKITLDSYLNSIYAYHGSDTPRSYIEAEYGDVMSELVHQTNQYFLRVPVYRSQEHLEAAEENIWQAGVEMQSDPAIYLHAGWHCRFCYFKDPCLNYHTPERDVILATQYRLNIRMEDEANAELADVGDEA